MLQPLLFPIQRIFRYITRLVSELLSFDRSSSTKQATFRHYLQEWLKCTWLRFRTSWPDTVPKTIPGTKKLPGTLLFNPSCFATFIMSFKSVVFSFACAFFSGRPSGYGPRPPVHRGSVPGLILTCGYFSPGLWILGKRATRARSDVSQIADNSCLRCQYHGLREYTLLSV